LLKSDQSGELAANLLESGGGNRGSCIADRPGERVDPANIAREDFAETGSPAANTTLVPEGRTREVIVQTIANSITWRKSAGDMLDYAPDDGFEP